MDAITAERLARHVDHLAGVIGERNVYHPQALQAAEDYIQQCWQDQGYTVILQDYVAKGVRSANLEITCRGSTRPEEIILLGAHYDSVRGSPGANDNASGVAALLELSRLFRNRVALTPAGAHELAAAGHAVLVEAGAGIGSGFPDGDYARAGADLVTAQAAWNTDLVLKVKEPLAQEYLYLQEQMVFIYFHLAGVTPALTGALLASGTTAIAYETVEDDRGSLPLLAPMSAVAGNMAVTMGNYYLARFNNGKGMLLSRLFGVRYGKVVIIGDGVVGRHSAQAADSLGAHVHIVGRHPERAPALERDISTEIRFVQSEPGNIAAEMLDADLVIGAVLRRGARAPHVVTEAMVRRMQPGSVIVDVSIDQGGCVETARATTHGAPVYETHGVIHYCVANMPGAYPRLSTLALTRATLPYALRLAGTGLDALRADPGFARGVNTPHDGRITCRAVAEALGRLDTFREFD
jgi:alanine dehydrogenase